MHRDCNTLNASEELAKREVSHFSPVREANVEPGCVALAYQLDEANRLDRPFRWARRRGCERLAISIDGRPD